MAGGMGTAVIAANRMGPSRTALAGTIPVPNNESAAITNNRYRIISSKRRPNVRASRGYEIFHPGDCRFGL
jgi:hypothetical protein